MNIIQEVEQINSIKGLKINGQKNNISTYELWIVGKAHSQPFFI